MSSNAAVGSATDPVIGHDHRADDADAHHHDEGHREGLDGRDVVRIGLVAGVAAVVWFHVWEPFPRVSVVGLAGTLIGGWPIFHEAWENLRDRRMTMELSMTIA